MASHKTSILNRKGLVVWLTGLTVLYQAMYHVIMMRALQQEAADDACASGSPHCLEVQLFRTWEQLAPRTQVLGPEIGVEASEASERSGGGGGEEADHRDLDLQTLLLRRLSQATPAPGAAEVDQHAHAQFEEQRRALLEGHITQEDALLAELEKATPSGDAEGDVAAWSRQLAGYRQHLASQEFQALAADLKNSTLPLHETDDAHPLTMIISETIHPWGHKEWEADFVGRAQGYLRELCTAPERRGRKVCMEALSSEKGLTPQVPETVDERLAATGNDSAAWSRTFQTVVREAQREMCQEPHRRNRSDCIELMDSIAKAEQAEKSSATQSHEAWEKAFVDRAQKYLRELCNEPERRGSPVCAKVLSPEIRRETETAGAVEERLAAAGNNSAAWSRTFQVIVRETQREMCQEPHRQNRSDCIELMDSIAKAEQAEQSEAGVKRGDLPSLEERLAATGEDSALWSRTFKSAIREAQREMCQEPHRQGRADCVELLASIAAEEKHEREEERASRRVAGEARRRNISAEAAQWDAAFQQLSLETVAWRHEFVRKVRAEQREMCQEAHRRDRPDCVGLLASIAEAERHEAAQGNSGQSPSPVSSTAAVATVPEAARTSLRQGKHQLQWTGVAMWHSEGWLSRHLATFRKGNLLLDRTYLQQDMRWSGEIPKAACIMAFQSGGLAAGRMRYQVERFRHQTYEGPSQLILVYHHEDSQAADLARLYADGTRIKAVAARGADHFPSTTALRFGAWSADGAQVVVHWAFEEVHSRQRLALQVRAIADSGRPGCVLKSGGDAKDGLQEESLAGEAAWMQKHWYPLLGQWSLAPLKSMLKDQIVKVDMAAGDSD